MILPYGRSSSSYKLSMATKTSPTTASVLTPGAGAIGGAGGGADGGATATVGAATAKPLPTLRSLAWPASVVAPPVSLPT